MKLWPIIVGGIAGWLVAVIAAVALDALLNLGSTVTTLVGMALSVVFTNLGIFLFTARFDS